MGKIANLENLYLVECESPKDKLITLSKTFKEKNLAIRYINTIPDHLNPKLYLKTPIEV